MTCRCVDTMYRIAAELGKTKEETVAQFLQQAFHDPFVEMEEDVSGSDLKRSSACHQQVSSWRARNDTYLRSQDKLLPLMDQNDSNDASIAVPSPFADASHPILGQAAALASVVGSDVVSVSSKAALDYLTDENKQQLGIKIGDSVHTKFGRGIVEDIDLDQGNLIVKSPTSVMNIKITDVLNVFESKDSDVVKPWNCLPTQAQTSQALAAGILGGATIIAKALRRHHEQNVQQLLQQLVILQSKKVKAKMQQLEELWSALMHEYEDIEDSRLQLMRERIEIGRQRLQSDFSNTKNEEACNWKLFSQFCVCLAQKKDLLFKSVFEKRDNIEKMTHSKILDKSSIKNISFQIYLFDLHESLINKIF
ncbi:hypothetical protein RFI_27725 [Reticulomyxa filosa]|uniref:SMARCC C-terminal domain-containing protein n=1 Tax=Reticulomyxa filosa TaxID=46433 RepID=X6M9G2_RETFI|nr:hypothetical protein RFI_27725 [Reticulomyxa filosa]|eukprot:ETO09655.1 hypothetical protein RFI_27725 [Reticulomyxa filosa]